MEDIPVERGFYEVAEMEEPRARQSEYVNMQALQLHQRLEELVGDELTAGTASAALASLPAPIIDAVERYLTEYQEDIEQMQAAAARCEEEKARSTARAAALSEKAERLRSESAYLTEKNSANLKAYREQLKQSGELAKERNRELVTINRKREKAEMDIKRTEMELVRLRKISKRTK